MLNHPFMKEIEKFLKVQLIDVESIEFKLVNVDNQYATFDIEDTTGLNFELPKTIGVRVKVRMFQNINRDIMVSAYYFKYERGLEEILSGDNSIGNIYSIGTFNFLKERTPDVNLRKHIPVNRSGNAIASGTVREAKQLNHLMKETLLLQMSNLGKNYVEYRVLSFDKTNDLTKNGEYIYIKFYSDEIYLMSKTPNYAGTLTVYLKDDTSQYGVKGSYRHSLTHEELKAGKVFSFKEIYNAMSSGRKVEHDFRKVAR